MEKYWHLDIFAPMVRDTLIHHYILSQASFINEIVTLTMSKVPFLLKLAKQVWLSNEE